MSPSTSTSVSLALPIVIFYRNLITLKGLLAIRIGTLAALAPLLNMLLPELALLGYRPVCADHRVTFR